MLHVSDAHGAARTKGVRLPRAAGGQGVEGGVGLVDVEAQGLVEADGGGVVGLDVEHADVEALGREVLQAGDGEVPAEAPADEVRVDGDHVDLAEGGVAVAGRVDLGPAEAGEAAVVLVEQEALGVEPGLGHAPGQHLGVQPPCSGCQAKARLLTASQASSSSPGRKGRVTRSVVIVRGSERRIWNRLAGPAPGRRRRRRSRGAVGAVHPPRDVGAPLARDPVGTRGPPGRRGHRSGQARSISTVVTARHTTDVVRPRTPAGRARETMRRLIDEYPDARCELDHENPFQLLAATILSAQCTDARVNMVTPHLFARYPTPWDLAEADPPSWRRSSARRASSGRRPGASSGWPRDSSRTTTARCPTR